MADNWVALPPHDAPEVDMSLPMQSRSQADQFRKNAQDCAILAERALSENDRRRILTIRKAWLALADNEDWLQGAQKPQQVQGPRLVQSK